MKTTSYKKAITILYNIERTSNVTISWKEYNGIELINRTKNMRAWEALNVLENINKLAFIKLAA